MAVRNLSHCIKLWHGTKKQNVFRSVSAPTMLRCRDGVGQMMICSWFPPTTMLRIKASRFKLVSSDPNVVSPKPQNRAAQAANIILMLF